MSKSVKKYKFAVIATDVVILGMDNGELKVLLIKMKKSPYADAWAAPGGLVGGGESVDAAAGRILREKTGVANVYLEQLYTFGKVNRDPFGRVVSVAYFALLPDAGIKLKTTDEYVDVRWFSVADQPKLAYDHKEIIACAVKRLRSKLEYTNIVYGLLPAEFTLGALQKTYEIILGRELDKRNFRKKILSLGLVMKTEKRTAGEPNRPAVLYRFKKRSLQNIEIL
jgi:8-oxo-dGTP diphosphatase